MKRNRLLSFAAACCLALFATSCSDVTDDDANALPEGKYPMAFTAAVDGLAQTRATTDNAWTGGEEVAVQIGSEVKLYIAAQDGTLSVAEDDVAPWYWQNTTDTKTVSAWYPYNATKLAADALKVKADQRDNGYQASDYLEAVETEVTFRSPALTFKHRTAKVVVTLKAGDGVSAGDVAGATVKFLNQTGVEGDNITEIFPKKGTDNGSVTYTALVVPNQMRDKKFIQVTVGTGNAARDYFYTPTGRTDANLTGGNQYTYNITVTRNGLAVTASGATAWEYSQTTDVESKELASGFVPSDLKIGDYYYSDGTWSDGGYREYAGGLTDLLPVMPVLTGADGNDRTVIGIVYCTDVNRIGATATKVLKEKGVTPHGLVMALTNASEDCEWGDEKNDENNSGNDGAPVKANTNQSNKQYSNVDGYGETQWIINEYGKSDNAALQKKYTAFFHASRYGTAASDTEKYAAPANTTGWFIPSMGQWWDILSGLGGIDLSSYRNGTKAYEVINGAAPTAVGNMNKYLQRISGASIFSTSTRFWSSSEYDGYYACYVNFDRDDALRLSFYSKYLGNTRVRCSLAF